MAQAGAHGLHLSTIALILANILIPLSIIVFGVGFFPYKPLLPGLAEYETTELGSPPNAQFDRLVFMVVDALRRCVLQMDATIGTSTLMSKQ